LGQQTIINSASGSTGLFVYDRRSLPVAVAAIDASTAQPAQASNTITLDGSGGHNNGNGNVNVNSTHIFFAPKAEPGLVYTWTQIDGNSVTLFGYKTTLAPLTADVITVWTWDAANMKWAFFTPAMTAAELAAYTASKGYLVLQSIAPSQGFWINGKNAASQP